MTTRIRLTSLRPSIGQTAEVTLLCLLTGASASAQSPNAQPHCGRVAGSVMTTFVDESTTLGTATGDLRGAISAAVVGVAPGQDGSTTFTVQHQWVTEAGDRIDTDVALAMATEIGPGLFAILSYPVRIIGGSGRFDGATGTVQNIGAVDLGTGRTVFRYEGDVCFRARSN